MNTEKIQILQGVPDDRFTRAVGMKNGGMVNIILPGSAIFATRLPLETLNRLEWIIINPWQKSNIKRYGGAAPLINYVGEADLCSYSLAAISSIVENMGGACFNHPARIYDTRRHLAGATLSNIPEIFVPRTELIAASHTEDLLGKIQAAGLRYPLIMRIPGYHAGYATGFVATPEDVPRIIYSLPVGGKPLYVTEFVNCRSPDGLNRKLRLAVVGRQVFARHFISSTNWSVHVSDRLESESASEAVFLDGFPGTLQLDAISIALKIADRLGLDYFGIDCCPLPDGRLVIFEANASMDILRNSFPDDSRWERRISPIRKALSDLLLDPSRWRHQGIQALK